ncbi:MAG: holo-[acyl-carrier-protein] synthase [Candidatus Abyssobacteria bacterium SURF_5]|uniref:Holo-[acyl-carrier-protein] synthase n=1 Tax=Abyssobacteria bacterium (strain SURF_5) TaxID=2093360 RepID=A0A3A4P880_ABYX5|nr:MAG: holo-[acyl-carrier-protein] synthase [Candidatus Abyssubacteria bacterium SURF_5]
MTVLGNGIDIIEIERIERAIARQKEKFLERVYTQEEIDFCMKKARPAMHFAARFAAKEAVAKALGTGLSRGVRMRDIEVAPAAAGPPKVRLYGGAAKIYDALGGKKILLSLSHSREQAIAHAIIS